MTITGRAIDISNYTGPLTEAGIAAIQAANVKLVVVRLSMETSRGQLAIARQQIIMLASREIPWQGYFWCYYDQPPGPSIRALDSAYGDLWAGYHGSTLWLDDEDEETIGEDNYRWLHRAAGTARRLGFTPGIYSRPSLWDGSDRPFPAAGYALEFATWPLWLTAWGLPIGERPSPVAPWLQVTMAQYRQGQLAIPGIGPFDPNVAFGVD